MLAVRASSFFIFMLGALCLPFVPDDSFGNLPFLIDVGNSEFYDFISAPGLYSPIRYLQDNTLLPDISATFDLSPIQMGTACRSRELHPLVKKFASNFIKLIKTRKELLDLFNVRGLTVDELSGIMYDIVLESQESVGGPDPKYSAQTMEKAVKENFEYVTNKFFLKTFANSIGNYLFLKGMLTPQNMNSRILSLLQSLQEAVNCKKDHSQKAKIEATAIGYTGNLELDDLYTPNTSAMVLQMYADEWYFW